MSKSVAFLTLDWAKSTSPLEPNGCAWYRCYLPSVELENLGWTVGMGIPEYHPTLGFGCFYSPQSSEYGWDIVVLKLIMLRSVADILKIKDRPKQKVVVDVDDFYEGLSETNLAYKNTDPSKNPDVNREHYWDIIEHADALITSTPFLYDFYTKEKKMKNVFMVRNGIDVDRWTRRKDHSRSLPTLGWVGAIPWRSNDLETMQPFFGEFLEKNRLPFHHSGHIKELKVDARDQLGIPSSVKFTHQPRMPLSKYPEMFRKIDIGIVPLNNIPFNYAKSTIKGLEYTAAGVPFVSSYSPEYAELEKQGVGRVANNPEEWISHLTELQDPRVRKEEIDKNYENLLASHTMSSRSKDWDEVLNQILEIE